jgi:hypothetical protein
MLYSAYRTFRLDVASNCCGLTAVMERVGLDYWTGLDWIDLDCTDCLPVADSIIIKLSQPCVRVLVQASV